ELGKKILDHVAETVGAVAKVESAPKLDGRNMIMVLAPDRRAQQATRTAGSSEPSSEQPSSEQPSSEQPASEQPASEQPAVQPAPTAVGAPAGLSTAATNGGALRQPATAGASTADRNPPTQA
nr:translation initiation factor IF-3 C-terminal domain-containing protein [Actinomycetota bacterium]